VTTDGSAAGLRYGVIGTGMMGVEHINNVLRLERAEVTAIADPNAASRDRAQLAMGLDTPLAKFADHRELLASGLCDAVVIATPNHTHVDVLADVLASDLHVLTEKPLCTTVADCRRILELAEARDAQRPYRCVWMGLEYRYMPVTAALIEEVRGGGLGQVRMVAIREHRFPFLTKVGNWNRFNRNTGGTLVEKCCHFFDLMSLLIGAMPTRVYASGAQDVNHLDERHDGEVPDIVDNAYVVVDYANGGRGMLDLCMFAEAGKNEQELCVVGDRGKAEAMVTESLLRVGLRAHGVGVCDERQVIDHDVRHVGLHHGASYLEHRAFAAAIAAQRSAAVTLRDGLWSVALGEAAHRSIDEGRPVLMSEFGL
jgi:myo-inositol 2-dehydrogenase / D-chiro-inositol 1-dehydrogenase